MTSTTNLSDTYDVLPMAKLYFDYQERYIRSVNIFYLVGFLELFFGNFLNSENTRNRTCALLENECAAFVPSQPENCIEALAALPVAETASLAVDGNSQGCRALHSVFAETNPANHCPHISLTPVEDPNEKIKCQTSTNIQTTDLFTDEELDLFDEYALRNDIDPNVGHTCCSRSGRIESPTQPPHAGGCSAGAMCLMFSPLLVSAEYTVPCPSNCGLD